MIYMLVLIVLAYHVVNCLNKSHDDMLAMSCCHDINASISSSCCVSNNVEETEDSMGQDKILNGASSNSSSSSSLGSHLCLMARASKVISYLGTQYVL